MLVSRRQLMDGEEEEELFRLEGSSRRDPGGPLFAEEVEFKISRRIADIWRSFSEIWSMNFEIWSMRFEIWSMNLEIWRSFSVIWRSFSVIWSMNFEIWVRRNSFCFSSVADFSSDSNSRHWV